MHEKLGRRRFLSSSLAIPAGLAFDLRPLAARTQGPKPDEPASPTRGLPAGNLGKLKVTRLICGGNLFSGFAHSGDLIYVSQLLKHYFHEDKILDTLELCENCGINTAILRTDEHIIRVLKRYRRERGGKMQWIAQTYPRLDDLRTNVQMAIDNGAVGAFIMGGNSQQFFNSGRVELIGEVIEFMKRNGLVAGVGSHTLEILRALDALKIEADFYFKTLNGVGYQSEPPAEVAAYMRTCKKPWIAFKVLGAGRMQPRAGFELAFRNGADFVAVGMYDFQVKEDVALVSELVARHANRERAWCG